MLAAIGVSDVRIEVAATSSATAASGEPANLRIIARGVARRRAVAGPLWRFLSIDTNRPAWRTVIENDATQESVWAMSDDTRFNLLFEEVGRLRANSHETRNRVHELGVQQENTSDDIKELSGSVRALTGRVDTLVTTLATTVAVQTAHADQCFRDKQRDREVVQAQHNENRERLERLENAAVKFLWISLGVALTALASLAVNVMKVFTG
jgi:chromosome segregation ATPase